MNDGKITVLLEKDASKINQNNNIKILQGNL